ncbi:MAG: cytochrome P450 [Deltaproteobacteria bacterium]|nr:MAG: cytochrome P450 [Deltaproteobacteria bacterium]
MRPPGPGLLSFGLGVYQHGFLQHVGTLWREYGDVFQIQAGRQPLVFAMHPDAVAQVTVANRKNYDKVASYDGVRDYITGKGLVASTGELWRRQRKLMAPLFTPASVGTYAERMIVDAERLGERWDELAAEGEVVEVAEEMTRVTAAIILQVMFGSGVELPIDRVREAVEVMIGYSTRRRVVPTPPLWVPTPRNRHYVEMREFVHGAIADLVATRRAEDPEAWPDDLLTRLMQARDDETGEAMDEELLRDESLTIFFAGHETTARTMTFAWYALAHNPEAEAKLHDELDRVLGGRVPTVDDLRRLPYTLQVVKEVLRLYPAAPFYVRDAVGPDQIGGFDIPEGAAVMLSPYYTHRHPDFWEEPERFDPDRWTPEREAARHKHAYHPFAAGARICIGNHFSLFETHLLLAVLAQRFAPRLVAGYEPEWEMQGVLGMANGLPMTITRRFPERVAAK